MTHLILGTQGGVFSYEGAARPPQLLGLTGQAATHVSRRAGEILASVPHDGVYALRDGQTQKLYSADVRSCAIGPDGSLYCGIEPAMVLRSDDRGAHWARCDAIDALPTRSEWTFPPPPHEPHVLSIDFLPDAPQSVLAGVEVGGVLLSHDRGRSWRECNQGLYVDVHSVRPDRTQRQFLWAVTGAGFFASEDGGESWERRMEGMGNGYTIGLCAHPAHAGELLVTSGDRPPGLNALVYHTTDGGKSWSQLLQPELSGPHRRAPVPCFSDGAFWLGTDRGQLLRAEVARGTWDVVAELGQPIHAIVGDGSPSSVMH